MDVSRANGRDINQSPVVGLHRSIVSALASMSVNTIGLSIPSLRRPAATKTGSRILNSRKVGDA